MDRIFKSYEDLPATLNAGDIAQFLGLSKAGAYNLVNSSGFPTLKIGKRLVVPKQAFIRWVEENTGTQREA